MLKENAQFWKWEAWLPLEWCRAVMGYDIRKLVLCVCVAAVIGYGISKTEPHGGAVTGHYMRKTVPHGGAVKDNMCGKHCYMKKVS
jgi:hypothetical protein